MKLKIVFAGRFPPPIHGAAIMNASHANHLKSVHFLTRIQINPPQDLSRMGKVSCFSIYWFLKTAFASLLIALFKRPDVVIFELAPSGVAFWRDLLILIIFKVCSIKIIFMLHGKGIEERASQNFIYRKTYRTVFKNETIVVLSDSLRAELRLVANEQQVHVNGNGVENTISDREFLKSIADRKNREERRLIYISNMIPSKGVLSAIELCATLRSKGKLFSLDLYGAFPDPLFRLEVEEKIRCLGLQESCHIRGACYGEEKKKALLHADYMIFPTQYERECFPLVILEAYMAGLPVFAFDTGAIADMVLQGETGFVSTNCDITEFLSPLDCGQFDWNPRFIRQHFLDHYQIESSNFGLEEITRKLVVRAHSNKQMTN